ncbi:hypothetical protein MLD38_001075 [Melastoma candidum]|uniref:Uncharacterized protein n=1 Tax=Melastoma candidum TaxID=119954 RepID=A0ACB9SG06_9MYRT|nr:hypothetical protein MLD38_001075 [Melastoma candidum]
MQEIMLVSSKGSSITVTVRIKGGGKTIQSVARPHQWAALGLTRQKPHQICICTMLRNQAKCICEWVMYHARIGVHHWFIYDNNSEYQTTGVIRSLCGANHNNSHHFWPWIMIQEAGLAHCTLRGSDDDQSLQVPGMGGVQGEVSQEGLPLMLPTGRIGRIVGFKDRALGLGRDQVLRLFAEPGSNHIAVAGRQVRRGASQSQREKIRCCQTLDSWTTLHDWSSF